MLYASLAVVTGLFVTLFETTEQKKLSSIRQSSTEAYGGVLNRFSGSIPTNDSELLRATKFAVTFVRKHQPQLLPYDNDQYTIKYGRKLKLMYTSNGYEPYYMIDPDTLEPLLMPIVWGITYWCQLVWLGIPCSFVHNFAVMEYWDNTQSLYEHTFFAQSAIKKDTTYHENSGVNDSDVEAVVTSSSLSECRSNIEQADGKSEGTAANKNTQGNVNNCPDVDIDVSGTHTSHDDLCQSEPDLASHAAVKYSPQNNQYSSPSSETDKHESGNKENKDLEKTLQTFRLVCYNLWNFNGEGGEENGYAARFDRLGKLLRSSKADVITLQEVRFEEGSGEHLGPNQIEHLLPYLPEYQFVYQPAQIQSHKLPNLSQEGVAILSKYPIRSRGYILLPRNASDIADTHQRVLLRAEVDIPNVDPINVFTTHLSLSHEARMLSARHIWNHVNQYDGPVFVTGDFNAEKHNEEVGFLSGRVYLKGKKTAGLQDIWALKYGLNNDGFTFNTQDDALSKRIDFVFMREGVGVSLHDVWLLDDGGRGKFAASDHLGVVAQFVMKRTNPGT